MNARTKMLALLAALALCAAVPATAQGAPKGLPLGLYECSFFFDNYTILDGKEYSEGKSGRTYDYAYRHKSRRIIWKEGPLSNLFSDYKRKQETFFLYKTKRKMKRGNWIDACTRDDG